MSRIAQALWIPCLTTIVLMFVLRPVARGIGLVDRPGGRKMHEGDIPIVGGFAMLAGVLVGMLNTGSTNPSYAYLLASLIVLVLVGAVDDRYDLPATVRVLAQILATLLMIYGGGLVVTHIGAAFFGDVVHLGVLSVPFTVLIVLTAINAFNMFDGSDGVAGIQALIGLIFLWAACVLIGNFSELQLIVTFIGSVFGFLLFNWPSKRTSGMRAFMGDAGSTMLGFSLAWMCVSLSQRVDGPAISPVVMLWIFALPIYDLFSSMIRRMAHGRSPFHADAEHLHHLLKRFGFSSRRIAQLVLLASGLLAAVGVGGYYWGVEDGWLFLAWTLLGMAYYIVFASGWVIQRRSTVRKDASTAEAHHFWAQRR